MKEAETEDIMSNRLYAEIDGTWNDIERVLKTARDWNASEIVIVGTDGLKEHVAELHMRWAEYMIPIVLAPKAGELFEPSEFEFPPFNGMIEPAPFAVKILGPVNVVIENSVLRSFRPVAKSDLV